MIVWIPGIRRHSKSGCFIESAKTLPPHPCFGNFLTGTQPNLLKFGLRLVELYRFTARFVSKTKFYFKFQFVTSVTTTVAQKSSTSHICPQVLRQLGFPSTIFSRTKTILPLRILDTGVMNCVEYTRQRWRRWRPMIYERTPAHDRHREFFDLNHSEGKSLLRPWRWRCRQNCLWSTSSFHFQTTCHLSPRRHSP